MKKTISLGIFALFIMSIMSFSASAQGFCFPPFPVYGKYVSPVSQGSFVKIKVHDNSLNQDFTIEADVNSNNEYSEDLANLANCHFSVGDIEISVCDSNPACKFTTTKSGKSKIERNFIFTDDPNIITPSNTNVIVNGGGGGSGSSYKRWMCLEWSPCDVNGKQVRTCTQGTNKRTEIQDCVYVKPFEPTPVTPKKPVTPVEPPVVPDEPKVPVEQYTCSDGSKVATANDCSIKTQEKENYTKELLIGAGATAGFIGLYLYWRKRNKIRAEKMAKTFIDKKKK